MKNIFLKGSENKIPKNFKECYKNDKLVEEILSFCEGLEKIAKKIFLISMVYIVIKYLLLCFISAEYLYEEVDSLGGILTVSITVISKMINSLIYVGVFCLACGIVLILLRALASIIQNTRVTANISLYTYIKTHTEEIQEEIKTEKRKEESRKELLRLKDEQKQNEYEKMIENAVYCKICGADISNDNKKCHVCGTEIF